MLRIVEEALKSGDGTLRLIVFMGAVTCAALTLGGGAWLAGCCGNLCLASR
ncbi:hypothetical protein ABT288_35960 [Streptomyces sp. NPDC001093]|uniref:hypothetical protein n=1 Tax=Streptomyces sp. NPDC001093 TaxID=3154376 RepID=UPI003329891F